MSGVYRCLCAQIIMATPVSIPSKTWELSLYELHRSPQVPQLAALSFIHVYMTVCILLMCVLLHMYVRMHVCVLLLCSCVCFISSHLLLTYVLIVSRFGNEASAGRSCLYCCVST